MRDKLHYPHQSCTCHSLLGFPLPGSYTGQSCKAKPPQCGVTVGLCFPWNISAFLLPLDSQGKQMNEHYCKHGKGFPKV